MWGLKINKDLLPLKGQYFLWSAGTAPVVPFLPTYARQLGFSSVVVGIIYSILPIAGMLAKPLFGALADRLQRHKMLFIVFQFITALAFFNIQFIPEIPTTAFTQLDCGAETFFKVCNEDAADICAAERIIADAESIGMLGCQAKCTVTDETVWNELCESWRLPQFCPTMRQQSKKKLAFKAEVPLMHSLQIKDCVYLRIETVILNGDTTSHVPYCNKQSSATCRVTCDNVEARTLIGDTTGKLDCGAETNIKVCGKDNGMLDQALMGVGNQTITCQVECDTTDALLIKEVCFNWKVLEFCSDKPRTTTTTTTTGRKVFKIVSQDVIEFSLLVPMNKTIQQNACTFFNVAKVTFPDGSTHIPYCNNQTSMPCEMVCNNTAVSSLINKQATNDEDVSHIYQFWLFFLLLLVSWVGMAVVVSIGDAICFEMLGSNPSRYGYQRLWGSVGWGLFSIIAGFLVDAFSKGETLKNYTPVFYLCIIVLLLDMVVSSRLKHTQTKVSSSIAQDVGKLLTDVRILIFLLWCIFVGLCTAMIWNFLFWHLEDLASAEGCDMHTWIKTLQGLVMGIQCFGGEIPFFFFSGWILDKIGHVHAMSLVLLAFGVRFLLYSFLVNPWWCLPIELLQGVTFGIFYSTMASYASIVAPPGTEATVQGLVGAIFEGIGVALGSFLGGILFNTYSGSVIFRIYGIASLCVFVVHAIVQYYLGKSQQRAFANSAHYATPNEAILMLGEQQPHSSR